MLGGGQRGNTVIQSHSEQCPVPCITTAIFLQSWKVLLAHLSLSVARMRRRDRSICLNLHVHILSTVWSYGAPDSPSYRHTSHQKELGAEFVIQAVLCIQSSITAIQSSEGSHTERQSWTHTNTHTNTQALTLNCFKWSIKGQGGCSCFDPTLHYSSVMHRSIH